MLGFVVGLLALGLALLLVPAVAQGPGRGFVIVVGTALAGATAAYVIRRQRLR